MKKSPKLQGEAAEIAFLWKATQLGFRLSKPYGDSDPYDFVLDNGHRLLRIQIKTSSYCGTNNAFQVIVRRASDKRAYLKSAIDFFVIWIQPCDAWYVVPVRAVGKLFGVTLYPHKSNHVGRFESYRDAWYLLQKKPRTRKFAVKERVSLSEMET